MKAALLVLQIDVWEKKYPKYGSHMKAIVRAQL